jgi:hypothetical protein
MHAAILSSYSTISDGHRSMDLHLPWFRPWLPRQRLATGVRSPRAVTRLFFFRKEKNKASSSPLPVRIHLSSRHRDGGGDKVVQPRRGDTALWPPLTRACPGRRSPPVVRDEVEDERDVGPSWHGRRCQGQCAACRCSLLPWDPQQGGTFGDPFPFSLGLSTFFNLNWHGSSIFNHPLYTIKPANRHHLVLRSFCKRFSIF